MCHKPDEKSPWKFSELGKQCIDCHQNIHENFISEKYLNHNNCVSCHTDDAWNTVSFDHLKLTLHYPENMHPPNVNHAILNKVKGWPNKNLLVFKRGALHAMKISIKDQFEENGITDCKRCHGFENWDRSNFNHDNARFKLDGAHQKLDCQNVILQN